MWELIASNCHRPLLSFTLETSSTQLLEKCEEPIMTDNRLSIMKLQPQPYGAPFVTSRILSTEYNSVGQNTTMSDRIQLCRQNQTEYNSVGQSTILLDRIVFCWTELYSVGQNCILLDRIVFCLQNSRCYKRRPIQPYAQLSFTLMR